MFGSDNQYGVHPNVMAAINTANSGIMPSYGDDEITANAKALISMAFETEDLDIYFVPTGGAANCLALSALCPKWGAILCHNHAHIIADEGNGPEFYTGGARPIGIANGLKLEAQDIENAMKNFSADFVHGPQPKAVSISNLNENGIAYSPNEIAKISDVCRKNGFLLHCDGARFANALVSQNATPAQLSWQSGIDALSFGLTKNGALMAEAVIMFGNARNNAIAYMRKTAGLLVSKHRFISAQFVAMLENGLWLECAKTANTHAQNWAKELETMGAKILCPIDGNEVFAELSNELATNLKAREIGFYQWPALGENAYRFVASWEPRQAS